MFGEPKTQRDIEFDAVIAAVARRNKRQNIAHARNPKLDDPKHIKALLKRRKRKRGGPK